MGSLDGFIKSLKKGFHELELINDKLVNTVLFKEHVTADNGNS